MKKPKIELATLVERTIIELCEVYEYDLKIQDGTLVKVDLQTEELEEQNTSFEELREFFIAEYENKLSYVKNPETVDEIVEIIEILTKTDEEAQNEEDIANGACYLGDIDFGLEDELSFPVVSMDYESAYEESVKREHELEKEIKELRQALVNVALKLGE